MGIKEKLKEFKSKLKTIKNIEIIIAVVIIAVVAIIYSSVGNKSCESQSAEEEKETEGELAIGADSETELEGRLAEILSQIHGVGDVSVMITYDSTSELITASTINSHSTSTEGATTVSKSETETISPLVVNNNVIVLKEVLPNIKGVIVVAEGADDVKVKLELLRAVQTVLKVDANAIEIFAGK